MNALVICLGFLDARYRARVDSTAGDGELENVSFLREEVLSILSFTPIWEAKRGRIVVDRVDSPPSTYRTEL